MTNLDPKIVTREVLVSKLAKPGNAILETLTAEKVAMMHMAIGVAGEASEFLEAQNSTDDIEEIGDIMFYFEGLLHCLNTTEEDVRRVTRPSEYDDCLLEQVYAKIYVSIYAGKILDEVKKSFAYNRELRVEHLMYSMKMLLINLDYVLEIMNVTYFEIHECNLDKLGKRYSDLEYSDQKAKDRADKQ